MLPRHPCAYPFPCRESEEPPNRRSSKRSKRDRKRSLSDVTMQGDGFGVGARVKVVQGVYEGQIGLVEKGSQGYWTVRSPTWLTWRCLAWLGLAWLGLAFLSLAWLGLAGRQRS